MSMDTAEATSTQHFTTVFLPGAGEAAGLAAGELRSHFLVSELFRAGELNLVLTDLDRMIVGGAMPDGALPLPADRELGTRYFTERREVGIINIGERGAVQVGKAVFELDRLDCLYVGIEEPDVVFQSLGAGTPQFYLLSCPAHRKYETRKITRAEANVIELGDEDHSCRRRIVQYICPARVPSCQLVMGFTELEPKSIWNTMPAHTHLRRSEIYLYFDLGDGLVLHLMGEPGETRHLMVRDRQAVLSPSWSVHAGAGTNAYRFIWGMAGENQDFNDLDPLPLAALF
jgi:4-deoxy-L-threo-5-hexosulose-uronate ketol-isomerase